jgi:hypothetical protein
MQGIKYRSHNGEEGAQHFRCEDTPALSADSYTIYSTFIHIFTSRVSGLKQSSSLQL